MNNGTVKFTDEEYETLSHALHVSGARFEEDSKEMFRAGQPGMAKQFQRQKLEVDRLAARIAERD